jgi:hypothetical protein
MITTIVLLLQMCSVMKWSGMKLFARVAVTSIVFVIMNYINDNLRVQGDWTSFFDLTMLFVLLEAIPAFVPPEFVEAIMGSVQYAYSFTIIRASKLLVGSVPASIVLLGLITMGLRQIDPAVATKYLMATLKLMQDTLIRMMPPFAKFPALLVFSYLLDTVRDLEEQVVSFLMFTAAIVIQQDLQSSGMSSDIILALTVIVSIFCQFAGMQKGVDLGTLIVVNVVIDMFMVYVNKLYAFDSNISIIVVLFSLRMVVLESA